MRFLASAGAKRIIYISCNPTALAHDAAVLHHAGYKCLAATPIDQFPYSENVESVVVFEHSK
jgi:23S rRNA (uracil1939-C5)-methyltransferase